MNLNEFSFETGYTEGFEDALEEAKEQYKFIFIISKPKSNIRLYSVLDSVAEAYKKEGYIVYCKKMINSDIRRFD